MQSQPIIIKKSNEANNKGSATTESQTHIPVLDQRNTKIIQKEPKIDAAIKWAAFYENTIIAIQKAGQLTTEHINYQLNNKIIDTSKERITRIEKILEELKARRSDMDIYVKAFFSGKYAQHPKIDTMQNEVRACNSLAVITNTWLLLTLAELYDARNIGDDIQKAYDLMLASYDLRHRLNYCFVIESNSKFKDQFDIKVKQIDDGIEKINNSYWLKTSISKPTKDKTIRPLLIEARKVKNPATAIEKFQEALNLAVKNNDFTQQYEIAIELGLRLSNQRLKIPCRPNNRNDLALEIKKIQTECEPLIFAVNLKLDNKVKDVKCCKILCLALFNNANDIYKLTIENTFLKDLDEKLSYLNLANGYHQVSNILAKCIKEKFPDHEQSGVNITNLVKSVESEKEKATQAKLDKEKEALALAQAKIKYDEAFPQILEKLKLPHDEYKKFRVSKIPSYNTSIFHSSEAASSTSEKCTVSNQDAISVQSTTGWYSNADDEQRAFFESTRGRSVTMGNATMGTKFDNKVDTRKRSNSV